MGDHLRVAVVRGESLMEQGVLQALLRVPDLEVEILPADAADLASALRSFRPDAFIAYEMDRTFIDHILARSPGTVVVTMSLRSPTVAVYSSRVAEVASVQELVDELRQERESVPAAAAGSASPNGRDGQQRENQ